MAMGKRKSEQAPMWVAATELPISPGHPFYVRLNEILDAAGFDRFVEEQSRPFYAPALGLRAYLVEPDRGRRSWRDAPQAHGPVYGNRRRGSRPRGRRLMRRAGAH